MIAAVNDLDFDQYWRAVQERDSSFDGVFVYGVRSTGVFCRPQCPSRQPRRDSVAFFDTPADALRAGYRPCKRCSPRANQLSDPHVQLIARICRTIEASVDAPPTLDALAVEAGLSPHHLQRTFKRITGVSPREYADTCRLGRLKKHLQSSDVTTAIYAAGYGASSRVYEQAPAQLGMTPATYRRRGRGERIVYATAQCPLGVLLVAATARGVCSIALGDSEDGLRSDLEHEFAEATIHADRSRLESWIHSINGFLEGRQPHVDLPIDIRATAFQRAVWEAVRAIPYGQTRTYGDIARQLGRPTATRAVARAVASNPVALAIPCHRVVRTDGETGGYRWGSERKQRLLDRERTASVIRSSRPEPATKS